MRSRSGRRRILRADVWCHPGILGSRLPGPGSQGRTHNVIFVGSLLTHLDASEWQAVLRCFNRALGQDGLLIFTAHGRLSYKLLAEGALRYGLSDRSIPEMLDRYRRVRLWSHIQPPRIGSGVSLAAHPGWSPSSNSTAISGWCAPPRWLRDNHQDVFVCARAMVPLPARGAPV